MTVGFHNEPIAGRVTVFRTHFPSGVSGEYVYPYYLSYRTKIMCFRGSPALFNGMKPGRLKQFNCTHDTAEMVVLAADIEWGRKYFAPRAQKAMKRAAARQAEFKLHQEMNAHDGKTWANSSNALDRHTKEEQAVTKTDNAPFAPNERTFHLKVQLKLYADYFNAKYSEQSGFGPIFLGLNAEGNPDIEAFEKDFGAIGNDIFATAQLPDNKRVLLLGTALGTCALYEIDFDIAVPVHVNSAGKITTVNYRLITPPVYGANGFLMLNAKGFPELMTFISIFGYPKADDSDTHNDFRLSKRINRLLAAHAEIKALQQANEKWDPATPLG